MGNRLTRTSGNPVLATHTNSYNVRDQLLGDVYDANGNTTAGRIAGALAGTDTYDTENRLIQRTESGVGGRTITILYDADGNRVKKSVTTPGEGTVTTYYLVDTENPTGYAQVIEEFTQQGAGPITLTKSYAYGLDLISVADHTATPVAHRYYGYDGLGSVCYLTGESGTITDRYYYDAYGTLLHHEGTSDNLYLYAGEQWDPDLGLSYNRARYLNPDTGRFWSQDSYEGVNAQPQSLHKYLYAYGNPVNVIDPTGHAGLPLATLQAVALNILMRMAVISPVVGAGAHAVSRINIVAVVNFYQRVQVASLNAAQRLPQLLNAAQRLYPHLLRTHQHHVIPNYISRALTAAGQRLPQDLQQVMIRIPYSYHQVIHNNLYKIFPKDDPLKYHKTVQDVLRALEKFYDDFPLP